MAHTGLSRPPVWAGYAASLVMVVAAIVVAVLLDAATSIPNLSLIFVLPVVIAAVSFGWGPAFVAAVTGVLAVNFFLIEPRYTLRVADPANVWALLLLLLIATVVSLVAAQSRQRAVLARKAADQEAALHGFARDIVASPDASRVAAASAETLSRLFGGPAVVFLAADEDLSPAGLAGGAQPSAADLEAARWCLASRLPTRGGAYPAPETAFDFWPVISRQRRAAVLGVAISGAEEGRPAEPERLVEIVAGYLSVALDREALAAEAIDARVQVEGERMKADLLAAVSHDLKTPLSTILFSLQSLRRFADEHDAQARAELLALAETEAARLSGMVGNLLDVNRLEAGALPVQLEAVPAAALAQAALGRAQASLAGQTVIDRTAKVTTVLRVDPALFETALVNVLENAAKYAAKGSRIEISAGGDLRFGWIEVLDRGPGFSGPVEPLFAKFARGVAGDGRPPGTGLGLAIAKGFMEAQGGSIEAANREDGPGARVRLVAPHARAASQVG